MVSLKTLGIGLIFVVVTALIVLLAWGIVNKTPATGLSGKTRIAKQAPDFQLYLQDNTKFTLSEQIGKPIVVNFWASWCEPCRDEAPVLENIWRMYQDQALVLIGINTQDNLLDASNFVREFGITYPYGSDIDGIITIDYGVVGLPVTFFINRNGIVDQRWVGALDEKIGKAWASNIITGVAP